MAESETFLGQFDPHFKAAFFEIHDRALYQMIAKTDFTLFFGY
jgi:hypothetical protein